MNQRASPRSGVFTTIAWNGSCKVADLDSHIRRMGEHAGRLRIALPSDFKQQIMEKLSNFSDNMESNDLTPRNLIRLSFEPNQENELTAESRKIRSRNMIADCITVSAPLWTKSATGCKHGDWQPYRDAMQEANSKGADFSLLVKDFKIIDADRATPVLLDLDGVAYFPRIEDGGVSSITLEKISASIMKMGIPIKEGDLNEKTVARCREMILVGTGIGVCQVDSIDGVEFEQHSNTLFEIAKNALEQHYSDSATWTEIGGN